METIAFLVQGSATEPYSVTFTKTLKKISVLCTCQAGKKKMLCKHKINIINGDTQNIVGNNLSEITSLLSWLEGSDTEKSAKIIQQLEAELEAAKSNLASERKRLTKLLS
jgi:ABC-type hemin transport system ATPase subunit